MTRLRTARGQDHLALAVAFALVIGISSWYAFHLEYAPDETSHLTMVRHHAHHLELTTWEDFNSGALRGHAYNLFSPLVYMVHVPFQWLQEWVGPVEAAQRPDSVVTRLGSVAIGAAQLALTIAVVRRLLRKSTIARATAVALAANLVPQLRYLHSYVNHDAMSILAGTACFAVALRVLQRDRVGLADATLVGATIGFAALTRYHVLVSAAVLAGAFVTRAVRQGGGLRDRLRLVALPVALAALLAGTFHLVTYHELANRDVAATVTNEELVDSTFRGEIEEEPTSLRSLVARRVRGAGTVWAGAWGELPSYLILRGGWLLVLLGGCLAGLAGLLVPGSRLVTPTGRWIGLLAVAAVLVAWAIMASQWRFSQWGRYVLPAGPTALAALVVGSAALVDRIPRVPRPVLTAAALWGGLLLGLNAWAMVRVAA